MVFENDQVLVRCSLGQALKRALYFFEKLDRSLKPAMVAASVTL